MSSELIQNGPIDEDEAPDALDQEDTGGTTADPQPWDPSKIRISTKNFSLRDVVDQINDGDIDLVPDFQRDFVWKERQKTRLIESILLGIPLPAFYFNQDHSGKYQVVDGVQRLSTISLFMRDEHRLLGDDLEYLNDLHGKSYSELDTPSFRRFRSTQIVVHVIEPQTPDIVKYDIFGRVNTLGSPLSAQEIRHAMSKGRSRTLLKSMIEERVFDQATEWKYWRKDEHGVRTRDSARMANRELALRFCAFKKYSNSDYRRHDSLDAYLVEITRRIDGTSKELAFADSDIDELLADFKRAMANAYAVLGRAAFRRWPIGQSRRGPINRAVFEAQAIALSRYDLSELSPHTDKIVQTFREAFSDTEYNRAVTVGTGDPNSVELRLTKTRAMLESAIA